MLGSEGVDPQRYHEESFDFDRLPSTGNVERIAGTHVHDRIPAQRNHHDAVAGGRAGTS